MITSTLAAIMVPICHSLPAIITKHVINGPGSKFRQCLIEENNAFQISIAVGVVIHMGMDLAGEELGDESYFIFKIL